MSVSDIISSSIAFIALIISLITAYYTYFINFNAQVFVQPRIILTHKGKVPSLVLACEISNSSSKTGAIDDIILVIKYRHKGTKSMNTYSFLPLLTLLDDGFSVFKTYREVDYQPFQSILVPTKSRLCRYIVFCPGIDGFVPSSGDLELQIFSRNSGSAKWQRANGKLSVVLEDEIANIWNDPEGKSIMLDALENNKFREELMDRIF